MPDEQNKEDEKNLFNFLKTRLCEGGDGSSFETTVIINTPISLIGIWAEYQFVTSLCGQRGVDWSLISQALVEHNGKFYDILNIALKNGESKFFHFDINQFYDKSFF